MTLTNLVSLDLRGTKKIYTAGFKDTNGRRFVISVRGNIKKKKGESYNWGSGDFEKLDKCMTTIFDIVQDL